MIFQDVGIYMYDIKDYLSKKKITRWSILEGGGASDKSSRTSGQSWNLLCDKAHHALFSIGRINH